MPDVVGAVPLAITEQPLTITEQVDALIAGDDRPLGDPRSEVGVAVTSAGVLAGEAVALTALQGTNFHKRVVTNLYDTLRLARALRIDIDAEVAAEIRGRVAYRRRVAEHGDRAGTAADRARGA